MAYIGNQPYQGTVTGDNIVDGTIKENDLANPLDLSSKTLTLPAGVALPSQTGHSGKYLTTDGASASWGVVVTGVRVSSITYPGNDTAVSPAGGQTITLTGSGFSATPTVFINGTVAPSVSFVSSTSITVVTPAMSAGTYHVYVVNPDGGTAIFVNGISYSGVPTWTTASGSLGTFDATFSIQLVATSDSAVTYALTTGSTLPAGITLSSGGLISGTNNTEQTFSFSVDAIDAQNQETPRSFSVTIVIADPYFDYNAILISANGTNGAQNNTFIDSSANNFSVTRFGNTTQGTFSPFSQTGWGNYFDGSGDYLTVADNAALQMGSGDFTIEYWWYPNNITSYQNPIDKGYTGAGGLLLQTGNGDGRIIVYASGSAVVTSSTAVAVNAWNHMALVRSGTTLTLYQNGVSVGSATNSTNFNSTAPLGIGATATAPGGGGVGSFPIVGYLSGVRFVKGTAVYSGSTYTVPTTPLTAITNTSLLTCQSNRFRDASTNNFTITRNGDVSVQAFSPFNPTAAWSAATNGGSGYFDGSGDYLSLADNAAFNMGTGNFTAEFWLYTADQTNNYPGIISASVYSDTGAISVRYDNTGHAKKIFIYLAGASPSDPLVTSSAYEFGQWIHVAIVRDSTTALKIYVNGTLDGTGTITSGQVVDFSGANSFYIGRGFDVDGGAAYLAGYISSVRLVKGTAVYTGNFTPPTGPLTAIANTSFLCNFTNAGIYDATSKNDLETVGNAQISTTQSKFGGSSMYFDGTGDFLSIRTAPDLQMGSGNFTWECWFRPSSLPSAGQYKTLWSQRATASGYGGPCIVMDSAGNYLLFISNAAVTNWQVLGHDSGHDVTLNTWQHLALVKNGSSINLYKDGVSGSAVTASEIVGTSGNTVIGSGAADGVQAMDGYIDDLRITKGYARYTSNFTPPTAAHKLR